MAFEPGSKERKEAEKIAEAAEYYREKHDYDSVLMLCLKNNVAILGTTEPNPEEYAHLTYALIRYTLDLTGPEKGLDVLLRMYGRAAYEMTGGNLDIAQVIRNLKHD